MDPVEILLEEFREFRRESREGMGDLWGAIKDGQQRGDDRMTKIEIEQGKQKVRTGVLGVIAGVLSGIGARLF